MVETIGSAFAACTLGSTSGAGGIAISASLWAAVARSGKDLRLNTRSSLFAALIFGSDCLGSRYGLGASWSAAVRRAVIPPIAAVAAAIMAAFDVVPTSLFAFRVLFLSSLEELAR